MATKTHVVIFREVMDRNGPPEIFTCSAAEADEIEILLAAIESDGLGPIERVSYTEFVEQIASITVAELLERFPEEFEEPEEAEEA
jgi:hypothetical protein